MSLPQPLALLKWPTAIGRKSWKNSAHLARSKYFSKTIKILGKKFFLYKRLSYNTETVNGHERKDGKNVSGCVHTGRPSTVVWASDKVVAVQTLGALKTQVLCSP